MRFLLFILLMACSQQDSGPITKREQSATKSITLTVTLKPMAADKCGGDVLDAFGCAKDHGSSCEIIAEMPKGFDDGEAIKTLGHELWHCFHGPVHD